jgi:hypothetical protein
VLCLCILELVDPAAGDIHLHAVGREGLCGDKAKTGTTASDDGDPTLDVEEGSSAEIILGGHGDVYLFDGRYFRRGRFTRRKVCSMKRISLI